MKNIFLILIFISVGISGYAQQDSIQEDRIAIIARPSQDSIILRWAPLTMRAWMKGNESGYIIQKFVMVRGGKVLKVPELKTFTPLKPLPLELWEPLVKSNKYAAIAAQALYGDRFEINLKQSDVVTIVNKVKETEQRYSFALFSADMSASVAKASGLWFTDTQVKKGEKYLYRIVINNDKDTIRGSIFISPDDQYSLPKPKNLKANFKDKLVSLKWDKGPVGKYTAYVVERSINGEPFQPISDVPLTTISPTENSETRYEYAVDSIADPLLRYNYRVRGLNAFGETSSPSDTVSVKGHANVTTVPYITKAENINNDMIRLAWDFPEKDNAAIIGFIIERSSNPSISFNVINSPTVSTRIFDDKSPGQVNYYRVTALGKDGEKYLSPVYYAQLVDSIPPMMPVGLKATIDESGIVALSWIPNKDNDIYGYRIYKANNSQEELAQITSAPISNSFFTDRVNLNTLNDSICYSVMAIDNNQNHSTLSNLLKIALPDKIKPQPPVFLPVTADDNGVKLSWIKSSSSDVVRYDVYRRVPGSSEWRRIKIIENISDSIFYYTDAQTLSTKLNDYTVVAIDDAGLESIPSTPVSAGKIDNKLRSAVQWKAAQVNREQGQVLLTWQYEVPEVEKYWIYKAKNEEPGKLYKTIPADKREHIDILQPGKYYYKIMAVFKNGNKSSLSEVLNVEF